MKILDLTKAGGHGLRPCPEFLEYIHKLLDIKGNTDFRVLSDRAYEVCQSASMYNLTGDEDNELYAGIVIIDGVHPAMSDYIEVEALKCWVDVREIKSSSQKES